jgi:hypothetical protein
MKRKGKHMLRERNPVVRDTIRNPNRSNKVHGDKFRSVMDIIVKKEVQQELKFKD